MLYPARTPPPFSQREQRFGLSGGKQTFGCKPRKVLPYHRVGNIKVLGLEHMKEPRQHGISVGNKVRLFLLLARRLLLVKIAPNLNLVFVNSDGALFKYFFNGPFSPSFGIIFRLFNS